MKLFYRLFGSGKPVIILHGLFGISDNWVTFARQLSQHCAVYIPDLRNHGQSPHSPVFNFSSMEDDLLELIEDCDLHEIFLVGHSMGGKIAMLFAIHHPELVKKLVVVDIGLSKSPPGSEHQMLLDAMMEVDFSGVKSRSDIDEQLKSKIPSQKLRLFLLKNIYWRDRDKLDWRPNLKVINESLATIFEGIRIEGQFPSPALFIRGGRSNYVPDSDIAEIKARFPGASVETIADASHWVHADAPGEFFRLVNSFLFSTG